MARLLARLADRHVGGPLGEHEGAPQAVVVDGGERLELALGPLPARAPGGDDLLLQVIDADRDLLQKFVDFVGVVTAQAVPKLHFPKDFARDLHGAILTRVVLRRGEI